MNNLPKHFLFEDEIAEIFRFAIHDGDRFTLDDGTFLFKKWEHAVNDDGIISHVVEFVDQFYNEVYDTQQVVYDLLASGRCVLVNGKPIDTIYVNPQDDYDSFIERFG